MKPARRNLQVNAYAFKTQNLARMLRLNSKRSMLSMGGMSLVGTLTILVNKIIFEENEFVKPEIAEMRLSSKDFQRQQQSLPDNHSSNKENISFSPSLSRLRLKYQPDGPEQRAGKGSSL
eukprot:CAMPEP_0194416494 /NCGR_PEP_ID=MMETSP0176-20130528/15381_1 /TAXON_ID=216777 /ORGANISM="Proboscia alata, Strain PI-D3" /LENGTH=119 /DNA_ID=CAMNT_0039221769 /DNA_START=141 /DNA_END=500 /DNA_ORIENTATION=+